MDSGDQVSPAGPPEYDVFISYRFGEAEGKTAHDYARAKELYDRLTAEGFSVWFDKARLKVGCNWHSEIEAGCESSRIVVAVLTPRWKESVWTKYETYGAEHVIPILYEGSWEEVCTPPLARHQVWAVDLATRTEDGWENLFAAIKELSLKPRASKAERLAHLRYHANPYFVGREEKLNEIHELLHGAPTPDLTSGRVSVVVALGGVGKTALVRQYAEKFWRLYRQILWVDARGDLVSEFARLAEILHPALRATDDAEKARHALQTLEDRTERLLIIDNAENQEAVKAWIPKSGSCNTLITSRFTSWSAGVGTCYVYILERESARDLLLKRSGRRSSHENLEACDRLAKKVDYLPLALEQAAAYVGAQGQEFGFDDYIRLFDQAAQALLSEGVLGSTEYPDSVITTWRTTIGNLPPPSRALFRLASFLAPEPIPLAMFIESADVVRRAARRFDALKAEGAETAELSSANEMYLRNALRGIARYSMAIPHGNEFTVHSLVQYVEQLDVPQGDRAYWVDQAADVLLSYAPKNPDEWESQRTWCRLCPHAICLWKAGRNNPQVRSVFALSRSLGEYFFGKRMFAAALDPNRDAARLAERAEPFDREEVRSCLITLGETYRELDVPSEAEPLFRRALEIAKTHYGPSSRRVGENLNYLGLVLNGQGKKVEAESAYRDALAILRRTDPSSSALPKCLANLASILETRDVKEAGEHLEHALSLLEGTGEDKAIFFGTLIRLGRVKAVQGFPEEAEALIRRGLDIAERNVSADDPLLELGRSVLARFLRDSSRLEEADSVSRKISAVQRPAWGSEELESAPERRLRSRMKLCDVQVRVRLEESQFPAVPSRAILLPPRIVADLPGMLRIRVTSTAPFQWESDIESRAKLTDKALELELQKLHLYILTSLASNEDEIWVNLSCNPNAPVLPGFLVGTRLGRDLLLEDLKLKRFAVSLLDPQKDPGREFWKRTLAENVKNQIHGPLQIWLRIWVVPGATAFYTGPVPNDKPGEAKSGLLAENEIDVKSEFRTVSRDCGEKGTTEPLDASHLQRIWGETILPTFQKELREGATFSFLRRIHDCISFSSWLKAEYCHHPDIARFVESGDSGMLTPTLLKTFGPSIPSTEDEEELCRGINLRQQGDFEGSAIVLGKVVNSWTVEYGREALDTQCAVSELGLTLRAMGKLEAARELHEEVLEYQRQAFGDASWYTCKCMETLADTLEAMGSKEAASFWRKRAAEGATAVGDRGELDVRHRLEEYSDLLENGIVSALESVEPGSSHLTGRVCLSGGIEFGAGGSPPLTSRRER